MALLTTSVLMVVNNRSRRNDAIVVSVEEESFSMESTEETAETVTVTVPETETETETSAETETDIEKEDIYRVILDAGHGGKDGGTYSGNVIEKNINLDIVLMMKPLLEEKGIEVVMTRDTDKFLKLSERAYLANRSGSDMFVSIHCNYYQEGSTISGIECYFYESSKKSKKVAETVIAQLKTNSQLIVRSAKESEYYVLKNTNMPAVLVEVGYLSSKTDRMNLGSSQYKENLAKELVNGIWNYLEQVNEQS